MQRPLTPPEREQRALEILEQLWPELDPGRFPDRSLLAAEHPECGEELLGMLDAWAAGQRGFEQKQREQEAAIAEHERELAPLRQEERYERVSVVGMGGMGVVYRVRDKRVGRTVAMKLIRDQAETETPGSPVSMTLLRRFLREARVTSRLDHPGIVPVHDVGVDELGRPFYTMKLVEGIGLDELFRKYEQARTAQSKKHALPSFVLEENKRRYTLTDLIGILLRVCDAIAFAHERGIVHRDLKPANVLVGAHGEVYVMDWGLAGFVGPDPLKGDEANGATVRTSSVESLPGRAIGTAYYMPPEQARGAIEEIGTRSDVYALGAMLYELLTGRAPYESASGRAESREDVVARIVAGPPAAISSRNTPPELVTICEAAMSRNPSARFQTVAELADQIRRFRDGRVVPVYASGPWQEIRKWVRRNRAAAGLVAVVLAAIAGGIIAGGFLIDASAQTEIAKLRLRESETQSDAQASFAQRSINFFKRFFRSGGDTRKALGPMSTASEFLERGRKDIEIEPDPSMRCVIGAMLGEAYAGFGDRKASAAVLEATLASVESLHPKPSEAAMVLNNLAGAYVELGRHSEALDIHRSLEALFSEKPRFDRFWGHVRDTNYGNLLSRLRRDGQAEPILRRAIARSTQIEGPSAQRTLACKRNLSRCLAHQGRFEEAESLLTEYIQGQAESRWGSLSDALRAKLELVPMVQRRGDRERARALIGEVSDARESLLERGIEDLHLSTELALSIGSLGEYRRAIALAESLLSSAKENGEQDPAYRALLRNLGHFYFRVGAVAQAESAYRTVVPIDEGIEQPDSSDLNNGRLGLAFLLARRNAPGDLEEAEGIYRAVVAAVESRPADNRDHLIGARGGLGFVLLQRGKPEAAEPILRETLAARQADDPSDVRIGTILEAIRQCREARGDLAGAIEISEELLRWTPVHAAERAVRQEKLDELKEAAATRR